MVAGDALAVALMEHRQFTPDQFRVFHPGGKLGARLLHVHELMHKDPPLAAETAQMSEALLTMTRAGFGVLGVTDAKGHLVGIVTDGDLRRHMEGLLSLTVGQVMTRNPRTSPPDDLAVETDGVTMLIDPDTLPFVAGAEVDYVEKIGAAAFEVRNPNAASGCGCGSSFSV